MLQITSWSFFFSRNSCVSFTPSWGQKWSFDIAVLPGARASNRSDRYMTFSAGAVPAASSAVRNSRIFPSRSRYGRSLCWHYLSSSSVYQTRQKTSKLQIQTSLYRLYQNNIPQLNDNWNTILQHFYLDIIILVTVEGVHSCSHLLARFRLSSVLKSDIVAYIFHSSNEMKWNTDIINDFLPILFEISNFTKNPRIQANNRTLLFQIQQFARHCGCHFMTNTKKSSRNSSEIH